MGQATRKLTKAEKASLNQMLDFLNAHCDAYFKDFEKSFSDEQFLHVDRKNVARFLRKNNIDINCENQFHKTPLFSASCFGSENIVKMLIDNGANINMKDEMGRTPLIAAASKGFENIVRILIENGADANVSDQFGYTSLHYAAKGGHQNIISLLRRQMARVT